MGRTKGKNLWMAAETLVKNLPGVFTGDFAADKLKMRELKVIGKSGKELNKLSAAVGALVKRATHKKQALEKPKAAVAAA